MYEWIQLWLVFYLFKNTKILLRNDTTEKIQIPCVVEFSLKLKEIANAYMCVPILIEFYLFFFFF